MESNCSVMNNRIIRVSEYGILPNTDITMSLYDLMQRFKENVIFVFENEDYYLSPHEALCKKLNLSNTYKRDNRMLGICLENMSDCEIQGNGARFFFEGHMQPITLEQCERIVIRDIIINWKKPLVSEGTVVSSTEKTTDIRIDKEAFPHRYQDGEIEFDIGAGEWYPLPVGGHMIFDTENCIYRNIGNRFSFERIDRIGEDVYRFYRDSDSPIIPTLSTVVFRHNSRLHAGVFSQECKDLTFDNITVHSCGGLGFLSQACHNLTFRQIYFIPDTTRGRSVSNGHDDGMHLTCNSGTVTITECSFVGLMDDPINIHGCYVMAENVVDAYTVRCRYGHYMATGFDWWAKPNDEVAITEISNMNVISTAKVCSYKLEDDEHFLLKLTDPLSQNIIERINAGQVAIDNITNTAAFICTKNRFGSCRARGLLVSTPKPVLIEDNYFESSGSAILIAGDAEHYFESGACHDVVIRNNVFTDHCMSAMYSYCKGIISIFPLIQAPKTDMPYHRNIRIEENVFDTPDNTVLYAFSCESLEFRNNLIFKSPAEVTKSGRSMIVLDSCRDVNISNNKTVGNLDYCTFVEEKHCKNINC